MIAGVEDPERDLTIPLCRLARAIQEEAREWVEFGRGWPCQHEEELICDNEEEDSPFNGLATMMLLDS